MLICTTARCEGRLASESESGSESDLFMNMKYIFAGVIDAQTAIIDALKVEAGKSQTLKIYEL